MFKSLWHRLRPSRPPAPLRPARDPTSTRVPGVDAATDTSASGWSTLTLDTQAAERARLTGATAAAAAAAAALASERPPGHTGWQVGLLLALLLMGLAALQAWLGVEGPAGLGLSAGAWGLATAACGLLAVACALVLLRQQRRWAQRQQQALAQSEALAREQEKEAQRINDATQAAIVRLMNELQRVAEGDLTQQATVSEDLTGAIADSVNYTVEELRALVGQVQRTAQRVGETTTQVEQTSIELLAASTEQLREIRQTGQAVLEMAGRINQVSAQAQGSARAARQARQAAEGGAQAVQQAIEGMHTLRGQMQETAKRLKRLGESSQEIGAITELIDDFTEQTQVLALNAAIQAAAAGEAGRGFSVVAEEVQRLAERSADATGQIAALVRTIQNDTQDAVSAMERSTREVVEGTRRSDHAGSALVEIDRLSQQVAELIEQIAASATREAELAAQTADQIQRIFTVTEHAGEGTRSTVQQVRALARLALELRQSVARFNIG